MSSPTNPEVAEVFLRIGDLMEYQEQNGFKVRSYWRVAEVLLALDEPLTNVAARGELEKLPGVGEAITGKIGEILATGTCGLYERLKGEVPAHIQALLVVPGLTPRLVRILERERGVKDLDSLQAVLATGGLDDVPNLNATDRAQILRAALAGPSR